MWRLIWGNDHLYCGFGARRSHLTLHWLSAQGNVVFRWGTIMGPYHANFSQVETQKFDPHWFYCLQWGCNNLFCQECICVKTILCMYICIYTHVHTTACMYLCAYVSIYGTYVSLNLYFARTLLNVLIELKLHFKINLKINQGVGQEDWCFLPNCALYSASMTNQLLYWWLSHQNADLKRIV